MWAKHWLQIATIIHCNSLLSLIDLEVNLLPLAITSQPMHAIEESTG